MPHERRRLFRMLRDTGAKNLFIISGDRHFAEISALPGLFEKPLFEFTASSLNVATDYARGERNRYRRGEMFMGDNFGFVQIDWKKRSARIEIRDVNGRYVMHDAVQFK
jgi:alkaline phosphatase D